MTKKLRMIEAFAGIGSQIAAMKRLGVDVENVGISEIDKYAVQSYEAINGKVNNYGDITKVEKFDPTDLLIYSSPCFTGNTEILVYNSETKEQEYIQIKDFDEAKYLIVTVDEENNVVTDKAKLLKQGSKKIIKIVCSNGMNDFIQCTPEHKFKAYVKNTQGTEWVTDWVEAKDLKFKKLVRFQEMNQQINHLIPVFVIDIKDDGEEEVYDISCETYHWFFVRTNADAVLVHNCQDFSQAGLQRGLVDENGNQTRSGLLLEVARLLGEYQKSGEMPKYLLMENVKALVSKKFKDKFEMWLQALDLFGYNNYWKVLNAKDYGIPQNRERVFVVSIRKDIDKGTFSFPDKIPLQHRLKDLLETNVDEKYYISDEKVKKFIEKRIEQNNLVSNEEVIKIGNCLRPDKESGGTFAGATYDPVGLAPTLNTMEGGNRQPFVEFGDKQPTEPFCVASRGRNPENPSDRTTGSPTEQRLEANTDFVCNTLTSVQKDSYVAEPSLQFVGGLAGGSPALFTEEAYVKHLGNINRENSHGGLDSEVFDKEQLCPTLTTMSGGNKQPYIEEVKIGNGIGSNNAPKIIEENETIPTGQLSLFETYSDTKQTNIGSSENQVVSDLKETMNKQDVSYCIDANYWKGSTIDNFIDKHRRQLVMDCEEPNVLTPKRTEYGKAIRKEYEAGNIQESRHNMTEMQPRTDGISNTITTVQKDNMLCEPTIIDNKRDILFKVMENGNIRGFQNDEKKSSASELQFYNINNISGSITTANVTKIIQSEPKERFFQQAIETFKQNECDVGDTVDAFNKRINSSGCSPTLTTRPEGFKTAILPIVNQENNTTEQISTQDIKPSLRIRKLTPKECWRLMGFTDEEHDAAAQAGVSASQRYKQAGNSIVVHCLCFIFWKLLQGTEYEPENGFKTDWLEELFK